MKIIQASFFWRNDQPGGLGFTFGAPSFTPENLTAMFKGEHISQYMRESDGALGTDVVNHYIIQLSEIALMKAKGQIISEQQAILAALNIMWLSQRGFIPDDEFNGTQFIEVFV